MGNSDYKWLVHDIYDSIIVSLFYLRNNELVLYGNYEVLAITDAVNQEVDIRFANVDDLTNLLNMGMFRFVNTRDNTEIIDIPIGKMRILFEKAINIDDNFSKENVIPISSLDAFSIIDGANQKDGYYVGVKKVKEPEDSLLEIFDIAMNFGEMNMQEKFNALEDTNMINFRREKRRNK